MRRGLLLWGVAALYPMQISDVEVLGLGVMHHNGARTLFRIDLPILGQLTPNPFGPKKPEEFFLV